MNVLWVLNLVEAETERVKLSGNALVPILTAPPVKSPGLSGVKLLVVTMLSKSEVGKRSMGTDRLSGSALGSEEPLSWTEL